MTDLALNPVKIPVDVGRLDGTLTVPTDAVGLVLFAQGSGGDHQSPRNELVASALHQLRISTLLFDLLTPVEDSKHSNRFNVELLTERLKLATNWVVEQKAVDNLGIGYFGASTGAAAAIRAGADQGDRIKAIVSRGGRPDLAGQDALSQVKAPTLLLVGGRETSVIALNREALAHMRCVKQMRVISGATQFFEEPGAPEQVASQAADWFSKHLANATSQ